MLTAKPSDYMGLCACTRVVNKDFEKTDLFIWLFQRMSALHSLSM